MIVVLNTVFLFGPNPGYPQMTGPVPENTSSQCFNSGNYICPAYLCNDGSNLFCYGGRNFLDVFFLIEPFAYDGKSYYVYRFWLALGIALNSFLTLVFEKWFI